MPDWAAFVRARLTLPALREEREAEIVEDLARQLDDAYRDAKQSGASDAEARARAERHIADWGALSRQLSSSTRNRRSAGDQWARDLDNRAVGATGRRTFFGELRQDVFYGVRALRHSPALAVVAIVSLALGIGANTAIFSVTHALVFRALPVRDPQQLVVMTDPTTEGVFTGIEGGPRSLLSYHEFEGLRDRNQAVDGLFASSSSTLETPVATSDTAVSRNAWIQLVSSGYFSTLGVEAAIGRVFGPEIDRARLATPDAIISDAFWRTRLQQDPHAIGRTIRIRRTAFNIIGVLPPSFTGIVVGEMPDVWVPLTMQEAVAPGNDWLTQAPGVARRTMFLQVLGRLKPQTSPVQAEASLNLTYRRNLDDDAAQIANPDRRKELLDSNLTVRGAAQGLSSLRSEYQQPLAVLMALVALLLVLACANVANLLLSRATGRERELALRVALGAGRVRLVRQMLTESLLLAAAGATVGLFVAFAGTRALLRLVSETSTPVPLDARLDAPVLAFTALVTIVTGLLFGLVPALRATRPDLGVVLRGTAHNIAGSGSRPGRWPLARILVGAQVALSLLLLVTAGLFVRSLQNLTIVPLGYEADHLAMFGIAPTASGYQQAQIRPLLDAVVARIGATAGVREVSFSYNGLFYGRDSGDEVSFPGVTPVPGQDMGARFDLVGPRYFATLGIPVLAGRDVEPDDGAGLTPAWLNETMARYYFKDENPLGRRMIVHYSFVDAEYEIRGVVADSRSQSLRGDLGRRFYLPFFGAISKPPEAVFEVRTAGDAAAVVPALRQLVKETDARLDPPVFHTVGELLDRRLVRDRLTARLSSLFGAMALLLASIGLYGVMSYNVSRRVSEIGVRMAFGARSRNILALVLRDGLKMTLIGAAIGIATAFGVTQFLGTLLFGLSARDPLTIAGATLVLVVVATLAAAMPAWRACRTDPLVALRTE
jgi:predicted permease